MFKVGQKVWCAIYGAGVVTEVDGKHFGGSYPVLVKFQDNDDFLINYTADGKFDNPGSITLFPHPVEIVKAVTKPSIDWSHVSENFQYLAMDERGLHHLFVEKPERISAEWITHALYIYADHFASFTPGTCDWKDSLVKRPE